MQLLKERSSAKETDGIGLTIKNAVNDTQFQKLLFL
jgi:hypothetical protein